jgi:hypothetical protein
VARIGGFFRGREVLRGLALGCFQVEQQPSGPGRSGDRLTTHGEDGMVSKACHAQKTGRSGVLTEVHEEPDRLISRPSASEVQRGLHGLAAGLRRQAAHGSRLVRQVPKEHVGRLAEPPHRFQQPRGLREQLRSGVRPHRLVPARGPLEGARSVQEVAVSEVMVGVADQDESLSWVLPDDTQPSTSPHRAANIVPADPREY